MTEFKLDFVVIGGMKCASTSVCDYLGRHPSINFCKLKEPQFFSNQYKDKLDLLKYKKLFTDKSGLKGEGSTWYSNPRYLPETAKILNELFPNVKIIFIVRHPFKRIKSHLGHSRLEGRRETLEEPGQGDFIMLTMYGRILESYLNYFARSAILLLKFQDVVSGEAIPELCNFLEIPFNKKIRLSKANAAEMRYGKTGFWKWYDKNNRFNWPFPASFKSDLRNAVEKVFKNKSKKYESVDLTEAQELYIQSQLQDDSELFRSLAGFDYYDLKQ